jgi:hypothetical protein
VNRKQLRQLFHDKGDGPANALLTTGDKWRTRGLIPLDMRSESRRRGNGLDDGWARADFNDSAGDRNRSQDDGYAKDALPVRDAASYQAWLDSGRDPAQLIQQAPCMRHAARMIEQALYELDRRWAALIVPDALFPEGPKRPHKLAIPKDDLTPTGLATLLLADCSILEAEAYWYSELNERMYGKQGATARAALHLGRSYDVIADARSSAKRKLDAKRVRGGLKAPNDEERGRILMRARVALERLRAAVEAQAS